MKCHTNPRIFFLLLAASTLPLLSQAQRLYVKPSLYSHCPGYPCYTLDFYVHRVEQYFVSNTILEFLNGTHTLESTTPITLINVTNFTLVGSSDFRAVHHGVSESTSRIQCAGRNLSGFNFTNTADIHIENLTIVSCSQRVVWTVHAALAFDIAYNVTLSRVVVRNSTGYGLHADRVFGHFTISNSTFMYNVGRGDYYGGNARIWYGLCPTEHDTSLHIESSQFLFGQDYPKKNHHFYPSATGLSIIINCSSIYADITNIKALGNRADNGGNVAVNFTDFGDSYVRISDSRIAGGTAHRGGGLRFWSIIGSPNTTHCRMMSTVLYVSDTLFTGNYAHAAGGALYISHYAVGDIIDKCIQRKFVFVNCTFTHNSIPPYGKGAVMEIIKHKIPGYMTKVVPQFEIIFDNCSFSNNSLLVDQKNSFIGAIADIFSVEHITFKDCNFTYNNSTALSALNSNFVFKGNLLFKGNRAINGGALKFCDTSVVYIQNGTRIRFVENYARKAGGAIYAEQRCLENQTPCFFQPDVPDYTPVDELDKMMQLEFVNNKAGYAGDGLYGGSVDFCYTYLHFRGNHKSSYYNSPWVFNKVFQFTDQPGISPISSDPYGVCFCDVNNQLNCTNKSLTEPKSVYPGQLFTIPAVTVGQRSGVVPGTVEATLVASQNGSATIPDQYRLQQATNTCVMLNYTILSNGTQANINLTVHRSNPNAGTFYYKFQPPSITVLLRDCPWGFTLQHDPPYCDCDPVLTRIGLDCDINRQVIHRRAPIWIGSVLSSGNKSTQASACHKMEEGLCEEIIVHRHCPLNYCKPDNVDIDIHTIDYQCDFSHRGTLCGECKEGLSLTLGPPKCVRCTNFSLLLLPVFGIAGVALVVLLIACNLTVTDGMINGLIFYANFIQINKSIFFDVKSTSFFFIAWLNLDLGIETCFYDGMDAYAKTWLQFLFPIYIWMIAGLIIFLSRKYICMARLFGKNAVKVLATLFLLSYAKLQRTVIAALQFGYLMEPNEQQRVVWLADGEIGYFQGKHIPLFIVAVLFGILTLPYALTLACIQPLRRQSSRRVLFWVVKLKPLFDAYTGPYKHGYCFWPGLLLVIRVLLFTAFAVNVFGDPVINLMLTSLTCFFILTLAWILGGVYRRRILDILESLFILNLGVVSVVSAYVSDGNRRWKNAITYTSVSVAFVIFLCVAIHRTYEQIVRSRTWRITLSWLLDRSESSSSASVEEPIVARSESETVSVRTEDHDPSEAEQLLPVMARYDQYREPVLEYEDDSC